MNCNNFQSDNISEKGAEYLGSAIGQLNNAKKIILEFYEYFSLNFRPFVWMTLF